ncbi:MAG: hypothetical protein ACREST_09655, partial [Steroidobacteraceae bacterium]
MHMTTPRNFALALALTVAAATAHAGIKASAFNTGGGLVVYSPAEVFVPLNNSGASTLNFKLASAGKKILTYSAECAVNAPAGSSGSHLDLDIYVNGVVVAPTVGAIDAFCTSNGTTGFGSWVRSSITVPI